MEVRGILNKLTPSTYDELTDDFCKYKVYEDEKLLAKIVDLIFEKAVEEQHFCGLYSDLCKKQACLKDIGDGGRRFRAALVAKCQKTFSDESEGFVPKIAEIKAKLEADGLDPEERAALAEELESLQFKEKHRILGVIK